MEPICRDFPAYFKTERLLVRAARAGDGEGIARVVRENREHLKPWLPFAVKPASAGEYEALMRRWQINFMARESFPFLIWTQDERELIGTTALHDIDWRVPRFEIGYWLAEGWTGRGLMTEAVGGLVDFAREHLGARRLEIRCDGENERSAAVARRLGFVQEARLRARSRHHLDDSLRDTLIFGRIWPAAAETAPS